MSNELTNKIIEIIRKNMHIEYGSNYAPKQVLDNNGLIRVERELERLVDGKKEY